MFSLKKIPAAWDRFFFEERPTEGLAIFRIAWMSLIFCYFLLDLGNISEFYGPYAIISHETAREQFPFLHLNIFNLFRPTYEVTLGIFFIYGASLLTSIFGLFTRGSLIVALICMTSLHQRNIWMLSSAEVLMRLITIYLICSPCGHSLSLDSFLSRYFNGFRQKRTWPIWSLRLIQIQISVVYLWTVWHKLKGETWLDGSAVYYATRLDSMKNFTVPFILDSTLMLKLLTWGTLLIEFSLGAFIWIKEYRKIVIFVGIIFHLGIEYTMSIPFFELFMICLLINFFTPEELRAFVMKGKELIIRSVQQSSIAQELKEKIVSALRGQHEPIN